MDRALLWLHEQEAIRLNRGLTVFRPAMTIRLKPERRGFAQADFKSLKLHYDEQILQIHVMAEYAEQGLGVMADAVQLAMDYFSLLREEFLKLWLPDREAEISRQTTPESWRTIVESLNKSQSSDASWRTTGSRRTCLYWPDPAPARRGCWCIASPI